MTDEPDGMVISKADFARITTPEQAINFVDHKIEVWVDYTLHEPAPPTDDLTSRTYLIWRNRAMIAYGEIVGALQAMEAMGQISVNQFKALKLKVIAATTRKAAAVQLGVDP